MESRYINKEELIAEFVSERDNFWTDSVGEREKFTDFMDHVIDTIRDFPEIIIISNVASQIT